MQNLSIFPNFQPIKLSDYSWYQGYYNNFEPYADHYFGNLFCWLNLHDDLKYSMLNDNVLFKYTNIFDPNKKEPSFTILGKNLPNQTLLTFFDNNQSSISLGMVPEIFANKLDYKKFVVNEDRDSWDYIYHIPTFVSLVGSEYAQLRKHLRQFARKNPNSSLEQLDISQSSNQNLLLESLKRWGEAFQFGNDPEEVETYAIQERLSNYTSIPFECFVLKINNKIEGFLLYSYLANNGYVIAHHLKCSYKYDYMFDYIIYSASKMYQKNRAVYLNMEQDLGKEGLRIHKQRLRPERFLKKYTVKKS